MATLLQILTVTLLPATCSYLIQRYVSSRWRSLVPSAIATVWGTALVVATYLWLFDEGSCRGKADFACRVNGNQGVLALLALVLAVVALWLTIVTRILDDHRSAREDQQAFRDAWNELLSELNHNLIHVAAAFEGDGRLRTLPQISRLQAARILEPQFAARLPQQLKTVISGVHRNGELYAALEWVDDFHQNPPTELQGVTRNSLQVLQRAVDLLPEDSQGYNGRYARDFWRLRHRHVHVYFYSSHAMPHAAHLRAYDGVALCWWQDATLDGVEIIEEGQRFKDLHDAGT